MCMQQTGARITICQSDVAAAVGEQWILCATDVENPRVYVKGATCVKFLKSDLNKRSGD